MGRPRAFMRAWGIVLVIALAGCTMAPAETTETVTVPEEGAGVGPAPQLARSVAAPVLELGRAWTYRSEEFYNDDPEFTVVVARASGGGYLFAAAAEDDLVWDALWGSPWYGERDAELNGEEGRPMLRFPLADGATWAYSDSITLTARAATISTPVGTDEGFVITGANDRVTLEIHYSPTLGAIVERTDTLSDGTVRDRVAMTRVEEARPWVWYELGPVVVLPNPHEPQLFEVAEGYDHVIMSAGGKEGSRIMLHGPGGESWERTFEGGEEWKHAMLPATEGRWVAQIVGRPFLDAAPDIDWPVGWAYAHVAPVSWIRG